MTFWPRWHNPAMLPRQHKQRDAIRSELNSSWLAARAGGLRHKEESMGDDEDFHADGILLKRTCYACPEQYDALDGRGRRVGYLRLRHGHFTVKCPGVHGEEVLEGEPLGDGLFEPGEREEWLHKAIAAI